MSQFKCLLTLYINIIYWDKTFADTNILSNKFCNNYVSGSYMVLLTFNWLNMKNCEALTDICRCCEWSNWKPYSSLEKFIKHINILPEIVCTWLKYRELYAFQLRATALLRQQLEVIVVCLSQAERVFPRALVSATITSTYISDTTAMFSYR